MTTPDPASSLIIPSAEELSAATPVVSGEVKVYPMAKRPGITVLVIVFDAGATLAKHVAKGPITIQTLSGEVKVTVEDADHDMPVGGLMHIDARVQHELVAPVRSRVLLTLFDIAAGEPDVPAVLRKAQSKGPAPENLIPVRDVSAAGGHGGCGCGEQDEHLPELDVRTIPHAIRHATVFGALQGLSPESAMVLVAHHNPLPLLAQIEQLFSGAIEVTYLQEGPEEWKLKLHRRG